MMRLNPRWLLVGAAFPLCLWLAGCDGGEPPGEAVEPAVQASSIPIVEPPLDRAAIIGAVARAASDWASGTPDADRQRALDGRRFEMKLRFYCPGDDQASRQLSFDDRERVLRIEVEPEITLDTPLLARLGLEGFEAAEGFWVQRDWMLDPACPAVPVAAADSAEGGAADRSAEQPAAEVPPLARSAPVPVPVPAPVSVPATPSIGLAQFFTDQDSRMSRRESRGYQATVKVGEKEPSLSQGYDLILSGRLAALPGGPVIACTGTPEARPSCIVSVRFDHVALADPDGNAVAHWSVG